MAQGHTTHSGGAGFPTKACVLPYTPLFTRTPHSFQTFYSLKPVKLLPCCNPSSHFSYHTLSQRRSLVFGDTPRDPALQSTGHTWGHNENVWSKTQNSKLVSEYSIQCQFVYLLRKFSLKFAEHNFNPHPAKAFPSQHQWSADCVLDIVLRHLAILTYFNLYNSLIRWECCHDLHFNPIYWRACRVKWVIILGLEHRKFGSNAICFIFVFVFFFFPWPVPALVVLFQWSLRSNLHVCRHASVGILGHLLRWGLMWSSQYKLIEENRCVPAFPELHSSRIKKTSNKAINRCI